VKVRVFVYTGAFVGFGGKGDGMEAFGRANIVRKSHFTFEGTAGLPVLRQMHQRAKTIRDNY
jgi:hypothetical protein